LNPTSGTFQAQDGARLHWQRWESARTPRATVCLLHGLGEHVGRYDHVGRALTDAGLTLVGADLRGHGRTPGPRGHVPSYARLLDDLDLLISQAEPAQPLFLYGHSMGGNIVLQYGLTRGGLVRGVIATGPWLRLRFPTPPLQQWMARMMPYILPGLTVASGLKVDGLSRDPAVVRAYVQDPLVHDRVSAMLGSSMLKAGKDALARASDFRLPVLLMHGADDPLTDPAATEAFYQAAASPDKTFRLWTGLRHEIHNEPEQADVLKVMVDWLVARV
jgi:alpha-beta hydrolase superfamily lysophospholipase